MSALQLQIEGIGLWAPGLADYRALAGRQPELPMPEGESAKPPASGLSANERRRAPEGVLLAVEVAAQAIAMSGRQAGGLLSVFSSSRGDQAITDYMCATLATEPLALSPTKFHNSVHNAAAGYWSIAGGSQAASSATSHDPAWAGLGLLEAASMALAEQQPVLWVCSETRGAGPLQQLANHPTGIALALVLAPVSVPPQGFRLQLDLRSRSDLDPPAQIDPLQPPLSRLVGWLAQVATGGRTVLPISAQLSLQVDTWPGPWA